MEKAYRRLCSRIGATMLCHHVLINILFSVVIIMLELAMVSLDDRSYNLVYQLTYAALYLAAFMLPVAFFRLLDRDAPPVPMEMAPRFERRALLFVFAVLGVNIPCAYLGSCFMQLLESVGITDIVGYVETVFVYPEDYVLTHMTLAIVPAFCEEFLFRGLICRRLMPYGKMTAILGSALLFGLMHGNLSQLFYTTMAGVMLGWCYVETRSIWPGVVAHMLNNLTAFLTEFWYNRFPAEQAALYDTLQACAIVLIGMLCLVRILSMHRDETPWLGLGNTRPLPDVPAVEGRLAERVRGFFRPTMTVYVCLALGGAFLYLVLGSVMTALDLELPY